MVILCACEGADRLGRLRPALSLTPRNTSTTVWIGYQRTVVLTLENRGAVRLHVKPDGPRSKLAKAAKNKLKLEA